MLHGQGGKNVMTLMKKRKAISPVIATVILVAVAITVAVGVSYWMGGISSQYTQFEKVEIQSAVCKWDTTAYEWQITIKLKNSGTATATLNSVFINEIEVDTYDVAVAGAAEATTSMTTAEVITSGSSTTIIVYVDGTGDGGEGVPPVAGTDYWQSVTSGTTVNIKIHSAGGMDYIKLIQLV
jgi:flagellin-like protein